MKGVKVWEALNVRTYDFAGPGLDREATDSGLWRFCQAHDLVLVTANRNAKGSASLEQAIRAHNTTSSLPVPTWADPKRLQLD